MLGLQHAGCHSRENGNPETKNRCPWIPRIKCGAGSAGVYPDENRGRNDGPERNGLQKKLKGEGNGDFDFQKTTESIQQGSFLWYKKGGGLKDLIS